MIQEGELSPGSRVPEIKLCQHFGISRTPLREALKVLASEGLIELRPNRGSLVARIQLEEVAAVFEVMANLEHLIGVLVCERCTEEDMIEVMATHERLIQLHRSGDRPGYFRLNQDFHLRLAELTRNKVLTNTYAGLMTKVSQARPFVTYDQRRWQEHLREHVALVELLRNRDIDGFADALVRHRSGIGMVFLDGLRFLEEMGEDV